MKKLLPLLILMSLASISLARRIKRAFTTLLSLLLFAGCQKSDNLLKDYVQLDDGHFHFSVEKVIEGEAWETHVIRMISQNWLTADRVDPVEWWHWLTVIIPDEVDETEALVVIDGGSSEDNMPISADPAYVEAAVATKSIIASISNIPFQPVTYTGDDFGDRYEDDLIAFGWRKFLEGGARDNNVEWLAQLPMTRAVARGLDVVQEVSASAGKPVDRFVVTGASKRGWATWTTAISDDRVMAIAPIVIDMLNITQSLYHHWRCYGEWSPALDPYVNEGIMNWLGSRENDRLIEIVEPYAFIKELDLPKFLINASSDEFFVTDSWQFYWDDLVGEKYIQYVPNSGHGLKTYDMSSLVAFYKAVISGAELPKFDWEVRGDSIFVNINHNTNTDYTLTQWEAVNENGRDFRLPVIGRVWTAISLPRQEDGRYAIGIVPAESGYKASLLEMVFNPGSDFPFTFTTGTVVTPDTYPFSEFVSELPEGTR